MANITDLPENLSFILSLQESQAPLHFEPDQTSSNTHGASAHTPVPFIKPVHDSYGRRLSDTSQITSHTAPSAQSQNHCFASWSQCCSSTDYLPPQQQHHQNHNQALSPAIQQHHTPFFSDSSSPNSLCILDHCCDPCAIQDHPEDDFCNLCDTAMFNDLAIAHHNSIIGKAYAQPAQMSTPTSNHSSISGGSVPTSEKDKNVKLLNRQANNTDLASQRIPCSSCSAFTSPCNITSTGDYNCKECQEAMICHNIERNSAAQSCQINCLANQHPNSNSESVQELYNNLCKTCKPSSCNQLHAPFKSNASIGPLEQFGIPSVSTPASTPSTPKPNMNHLSPGTSSPLALNQSQPSIEQQETMSRILNDLSASLQPRYSASRQSIKPQQYAKRRKAVFNPHDHDRTHHIQCCDKPCPPVGHSMEDGHAHANCGCTVHTNNRLYRPPVMFPGIHSTFNFRGGMDQMKGFATPSGSKYNSPNDFKPPPNTPLSASSSVTSPLITAASASTSLQSSSANSPVVSLNPHNKRPRDSLYDNINSLRVGNGNSTESPDTQMYYCHWGDECEEVKFANEIDFDLHLKSEHLKSAGGAFANIELPSKSGDVVHNGTHSASGLDTAISHKDLLDESAEKYLCNWDSCHLEIPELNNLLEHIKKDHSSSFSTFPHSECHHNLEHGNNGSSQSQNDSANNFHCQWENCEFNTHDTEHLDSHLLNIHMNPTYMSGLLSPRPHCHGECDEEQQPVPEEVLYQPETVNVERRTHTHNGSNEVYSHHHDHCTDPNCSDEKHHHNLANGVPMYQCEWRACKYQSNNYDDFMNHVRRDHVPRAMFIAPSNIISNASNGSSNSMMTESSSHTQYESKSSPLSPPEPSSPVSEKRLGTLDPNNRLNSLHTLDSKISFSSFAMSDNFGSEMAAIKFNDEDVETKPILRDTDSQECNVPDRHICRWIVTDPTTGTQKECGHESSDPSALSVHVTESHVGSRKNQYMCLWADCDRHKRPFAQRQKIIRHLQTHTKNRPFKCEVCGNAFAEEAVLKQHLRIHSGEKPFACKICGKKFAASTALSVHLRTHTGEKPLACKWPGCTKRFSESSNLTKHMKSKYIFFSSSLFIHLPNCFFLLLFPISSYGKPTIFLYTHRLHQKVWPQ